MVLFRDIVRDDKGEEYSLRSGLPGIGSIIKGNELFEEVLVGVNDISGMRFNPVYSGEPRDPVDVPEAALASVSDGTFFEPGMHAGRQRQYSLEECDTTTRTYTVNPRLTRFHGLKQHSHEYMH